MQADVATDSALLRHDKFDWQVLVAHGKYRACVMSPNCDFPTLEQVGSGPGRVKVSSYPQFLDIFQNWVDFAKWNAFVLGEFSQERYSHGISRTWESHSTFICCLPQIHANVWSCI